ncbi:MAG TPA: 6-bladed beta-propeller [Bacillota bacterium]|nr:6-bladed beta-propeller [Bacillota bacterium]
MRKSYVYWAMFSVFGIITALFIWSFVVNKEISVNPVNLVDNNAPPTFNRMIYGGFDKDALSKPMDVAVINQFTYVTDTKNFRVQVFDSAGIPLFKFGSQGSKPGQFQFPYGITGDSKGNVYVSDLYNGCISVHDSRGKFLRYFAEKNPAEQVLVAPGSIRIVGDKLYVTDIQLNKATVFDLQGKKLLEIGKYGEKPGEFTAPNAIIADKDGNIFVVDTGNQRVQEFDSKGKFIRIINGTQSAAGNSVFVNPRGIGIDSRGIIYVVSNLTNYIYGFDSTGKQVFIFGGAGEENNKFSLPNGLFVDNDDQVYITDTTNQRVAVYQ